MMGFFCPVGQRDNRTEVPSLFGDKGTTGQAQNIATERADFDILPQDGLRRDFDSQLPFELLFEKLLWLHLEPAAHLPNQNANQLEFEPSRM